MTELFPPETVTQPSPRLAWIKKHNISTAYSPNCDHPYSAWTGDLAAAIDCYYIGIGDTVDDAMCDLARKRGWRLWNEEEL